MGSYGLPGRYVSPIPDMHLLDIVQAAANMRQRREEAAAQQARFDQSQAMEADRLQLETDRMNAAAAKDARAQATTQAEKERQLATQRDQATAEMQQRAAEILRINPGIAPDLQRAIDERAKRGSINAFKIPMQSGAVAPGLQGPPDPRPGVDTGALEASALAGGAKNDAPAGLSEIGRYVWENHHVRPGEPQFADLYEQERQRRDAEALKKAREGASKTSVTVGANGEKSIGLSPAQATKTQGEILDAGKKLAQLGNIRKDIEAIGGWDSMGDYGQRAGETIAETASKVPGVKDMVDEGAKASLVKRSAARAAIASFRDAILHELSGAAISPSEMERLIQSMPTDTDAGPVLQAKMDAWQRNLELVRDQGTDALLNGIRTGKVGLPGEGQAQKPKASSRPTAASRYQQLKSEALRKFPDATQAAAWVKQQMEAADGSAP